MKYVLIKYRSHTCSNDEPYMPLFLYATPLLVIKETDETVVVRYNDSEFHTYEFKKECIEKAL